MQRSTAMANKTTTPTSPRAIKTSGILSLKEKIAYGMGDLGNGFMFDLGQAYLLKFSPYLAALPAAAAASLLAITKLFDAFMNPLAGTVIDGRRTVGPFGPFRGVMFYSSIALAVLTVFTFLTPGQSQG